MIDEAGAATFPADAWLTFSIVRENETLWNFGDSASRLIRL
jgi:hypothetical protein